MQSQPDFLKPEPEFANIDNDLDQLGMFEHDVSPSRGMRTSKMGGTGIFEELSEGLLNN